MSDTPPIQPRDITPPLPSPLPPLPSALPSPCIFNESDALEKVLKQGFLLWGLVCVFLVHFEKARGYNILKPPQAHLQRQNTARISCHRSFKALDVVGLSWLTQLCSIVWTSGAVPLDWQTGVVVLLFKKGDRRVCSNYRGITLLSLPVKVYSGVLERRVRRIVEPRIQEEQSGFCPGRGTVDQLYTLCRILEGAWEFAQPVHMCFVDLSLWESCGGFSGSMGYQTP